MKISVLVGFLIVCGLTQVLIFIESVIVKKMGAYVNWWCYQSWTIFSFWPVGRFWLVNTYQYGCQPSLLSHRAPGRVECDESYCNERGTIFGRRGAGNSFTMSHTTTRGSSWLYMDFKCVVTSVPVVGVMHLYGKWAGSTLIWGRRNAAGFWGD
jgi:hypothetical protein